MQKYYSKEFKEPLIKLYRSGQSVTQMSKEYVVTPAMIYGRSTSLLILMKVQSLKLIFYN